MAAAQGNDPRIWSRIICCGKCNVGPKESSTSPKVTHAINLIMIGLNVATIFVILDDSGWKVLAILNVCLGVLAQILMACV